MRNRTFLLLAIALSLTTLVLGEDLKITKGPVVEHAGQNTAVIAWSTNNSSATIVRYGTDPNHLTKTAEMPWGALTHRVTLKNLQPGTTYYFQAESSLRSDSAANSQIEQFTTEGQNTPRNAEGHPELKIVHGPVLEDLRDTTVLVAWSTNLPSSSVVRYGTGPNDLSHTAEAPWGATAHRVQLKNLKPNTLYYFTVRSGQGKDAPGQVQETSPQKFSTATPDQQAKR